MGTALRVQRVLLFLAMSALAQDNLSRLHPHQVTAKESPAREPDAKDKRWFGDIRKAVIRDRRELEHYTRLEIDLPIEKDFYQHHLLLLPKNQGRGPFPAVVCWTSSSPDYTAPEQWWGQWLAEHGYVVLTSWSFIRHYRDDTNYATGAIDKVYQRFGHWLAL